MGWAVGGACSGGDGAPVIFRPTKIGGAYLIEPERHTDDRGSFARAWCQREFEAHGLDSKLVQCSISTNTRKGTLRGMHYSVVPHAEAKVVRCIKGAVHDVLLDLREGSPTYLKWIVERLSRENARALFVPEGVAHGFQALEDESDVFYQMSQFYDPECARGVRWNDPAFGIPWAIEPPILSERDRLYVDYRAPHA
jgi:dTDP-4-dehydrorhamnose 3,5-epimerase